MGEVLYSISYCANQNQNAYQNASIPTDYSGRTSRVYRGNEFGAKISTSFLTDHVAFFLDNAPESTKPMIDKMIEVFVDLDQLPPQEDIIPGQLPIWVERVESDSVLLGSRDLDPTNESDKSRIENAPQRSVGPVKRTPTRVSEERHRVYLNTEGDILKNQLITAGSVDVIVTRYFFEHPLENGQMELRKVEISNPQSSPAPWNPQNGHRPDLTGAQIGETRSYPLQNGESSFSRSSPQLRDFAEFALEKSRAPQLQGFRSYLESSLRDSELSGSTTSLADLKYEIVKISEGVPSEIHPSLLSTLKDRSISPDNEHIAGSLIHGYRVYLKSPDDIVIGSIDIQRNDLRVPRSSNSAERDLISHYSLLGTNREFPTSSPTADPNVP